VVTARRLSVSRRCDFGRDLTGFYEISANSTSYREVSIVKAQNRKPTFNSSRLDVLVDNQTAIPIGDKQAYCR
jgi:hypothetical protein